MSTNDKVDLFDHEKALGLISAISDLAQERGCNYLELAHACKCVRAACLQFMGENARMVLASKEGTGDEMLVVPEEDALG